MTQTGNNSNPAPQAAFVITNWNGVQFLEACLKSVYAQHYRDFEVIVVDNASSDNSVAFVEQFYPQVRVIQNGANLGLCISNNRGTLATEAEFIAILNNDTELEPDWLGHLVGVMQADPRIGMCASRMMLTDQRDMVESAGIVVDKAGIAWGLDSGSSIDPRMTTPVPVFGACGGAALYRRSMLLEIGLFDDDFFVYLEDADVAWRGQWADWRCMYVPTSVVYHAHSATIKEGSPFKVRLLGRNKLWLIWKNYPFPYLLLYSPIILAYELMAIGYALATGRGGDALNGRWQALRQIRSLLAKRRKLVRKVSNRAMMAKLHPVENPLTLWRRYVNLSQGITTQYK